MGEADKTETYYFWQYYWLSLLYWSLIYFNIYLLQKILVSPTCIVDFYQTQG